MKLIVQTLVLAGLMMALSACGGSDDDEETGFSGETSAAVASEENKQELAEAGAVAAKQAVAGNNTPLGVVTDTNTADKVSEFLLALISLSNSPSGADVSEQICLQGGSASFSGNENNATYTFNNCQSDGVTFDGTATFVSANSGYTITYSNFAITFDGETTTLNLTATCDQNYDCTYSSDFTADNGKSYRVENSDVSGNSSSGYSVNATVYDPDYGRISFTSTGMQFDCSNGYPSAGTLTLTDGSNQDIIVTFTSCTEYTVTFDGNAETFTW